MYCCAILQSHSTVLPDGFSHVDADSLSLAGKVFISSLHNLILVSSVKFILKHVKKCPWFFFPQ